MACSCKVFIYTRISILGRMTLDDTPETSKVDGLNWNHIDFIVAICHYSKKTIIEESHQSIYVR